MNILLLNGSARPQSNTRYALSTIAETLEKNPANIVELVDVHTLKISHCLACDMCKENQSTCVMPDDSMSIVAKVAAADMVIFGTPVYWWGVSSALKAVIDKFYSKIAEFQEQEEKKKFGVVAVGAHPVPDIQFTLIHSQFNCIGEFLEWEKMFELSFFAYAAGELEQSEEARAKLTDLAFFSSPQPAPVATPFPNIFTS